MVIRRIAPLSAAKIAGLIYALIGLPFALLVWIISVIGLNESGLRGSPFAPGFGLLGNAVAVLILPVIYGAIGFFTTLIGAWLYNVMAHLVGGLNIEVQADTLPDVAAG